MSDERQPGQFSYSSMLKAAPSQSADQAGEFKYPGTDMSQNEPWKDPAAKQPEGYTTMQDDGRSPLDREEDELFDSMIKSGKPEAFEAVIGWVKEDLEKLGSRGGANPEDVAKDIRLVDELQGFIQRTGDPRWKAWAVGMADQIRKTKRLAASKKK